MRCVYGSDSVPMRHGARRVRPRLIPRLRRCGVFLLCALLLSAVLPLASCRLPGQSVFPTASVTDAALTEYLQGALMREEVSIPLDTFSDVTEERLERIYSRLLATDPDLFFVTSHYTISSRVTDGTPVSLAPTYRYRGTALAAAREDFAARIDAYIRNLPQGAAPLARVADLHDRMILDFAYDESEEIVDPYRLLVSGRGVCQAYSLLFSALCRAADVPAETVVCFERSHAWNQVAIGDDWYHIDLTWDETALPYPGRVPHTYFLLTDRELAASRLLDGADWEGVTWDAPHTCDGASLSALELRSSTGRGATLDGVTLYFSARDTVYALDCRTMTRRTVYRDTDAPPDLSLSVLQPHGDKIFCSLARALLTICPSSASEELSLSHALPVGAGVYAGLSLSPGGYPLLTTVAYTDGSASR